MSQWVRILLVMLAGMIITLGVSGCMSKKQDPDAIKDKMLAYLEEKYGEEFSPLSFESSGFAYSYDTLWAYPKNGTKEDRFEVWGSRTEDGSYGMSDGYFGIYIKPKYEEVLSGFVSEIYKDFKLFTGFEEGVMADRLNKNTKIEEIYAPDELFFSDTVIFVNEDSTKGISDEEGIRRIAEKMKEHKMVGSVRLYVVFNDKFDSIGLDVLDATSAERKELFPRPRQIIKVTHDLEVKKYGEGN
ncbi:MAG: hypothetical protein E7L01_26920 [Paenibacillus macerans]|uniref:Lipoprotein n=2 Tax=Paenibacillus macerans TaxID=44252 RepID=A0A6N8F2U7_PAEMA|nr:hypothetical protein [Paenibacillus macerans]MBS5914248.1 hypothetical protein [Paenibacillus macerans]MCY7561507.1 hypothetical protein [Paenibacillus macerans]MDU5947285.1 hypothetical protein [Paenibacillus macerans]MDU7476946.1 hypothetical protein [Paenibacillus macerans]MEC0137627.1 hypothetical protein [Paenibacillus macerans]